MRSVENEERGKFLSNNLYYYILIERVFCNIVTYAFKLKKKKKIA